MLSVLLITLNLVLVFFRFDSNNKIKRQETKIQELNKSYKENLEILAWYSLVPYESIDNYIDKYAIVRNVDNNQSTIEQIYKQEGAWIYRYFNSTCLSCYEESFGIIRDFINEMEELPFVVLTNFNGINELRNFVSKSHFGCNVFDIDSLICFTPEQTEIPYVMHIDTNGRVSNCLVIQKDHPELLSQFLNITFGNNE